MKRNANKNVSLEKALKMLKVKEQDGLTYRELAERFDVSPTTVSHQLARALEARKNGH